MAVTPVVPPYATWPRLVAEYGAYAVCENANGALSCSCSHFKKSILAGPLALGWCNHLHEAVRQRQDAPLDFNRSVWMILCWNIKSVPGDSSDLLWAHISFEPDGESGAAAHLVVNEFVRANEELDDFLGFIGSRDGRWTLKSLVLEWLANLDEEYWAGCAASTHSAVGWEDYGDRYLSQVQREIWSLLSTGYCLECTELMP